ncbi:HXXEE domain-containing protein [Clostridium sp. C8-1-8]|uniref:HXXEE domain-containing protein n=1 Tax=Clostridium sp. C8-1-8 TaxID=2698831 RepID=UPI00136D3C5B|nr:HXXEE domain-containing protein [Clostridium sp. C8-1-8]
MRTLFTMIWLFPILFMLHDFEEILMITAWQEKNKQYIAGRPGKFIPYNFKGSTASIAFGVAIEFLIISILTIIAYLSNSFIGWFGLFTAFVIHLVLHIIMSINFKRYVPGVFTSVLFLPLCIFIEYKIKLHILSNLSIYTQIIAVLVGTALMIGIIYTLHKLIEIFSLWLEKYKVNTP